jgi:anti-anti-sigma regulatory factor
MLVSGTHAKTQTVHAGAELTQQDVQSFRARVGLALAAADSVVVDLERTKRIDSWALLAIWDLGETFGTRLAFAAPDYLREFLLPRERR